MAQCGQGQAAVQRIRERFAAAETTGWRTHEPGSHGLTGRGARSDPCDRGRVDGSGRRALAAAKATGAKGG